MKHPLNKIAIEGTISEIKQKLAALESFDDLLFEKLMADPRKGVHQAAQQWEKRYKKIEELKKVYKQKNKWENYYHQQGINYIAGIDEVGRGPLAGPVVTAAVILNPHQPIYGLKDSKQLSLKSRERLFEEIKAKALSYYIVLKSAAEIDELNIYEATRQAMKLAAESLELPAELLLIDAMQIDSSIPQKKLIKGDDQSNSIAAASILAKVTRDRMMVEYSKKYANYGFEANKGYGTAAHLAGLESYGPSPIHRKTFQPVRKFYE